MSMDIFRDDALSGKSILVTGGGGGLGLEIGKALAAKGAKVHICGRLAIDGGQHLAGPATFADLSALTDDQWRTAREAIQRTTQRDKAQRADGVQPGTDR